MHKPKERHRYQCKQCLRPYVRWEGRCTGCGNWNTLEEISAGKSEAANLAAAPLTSLRTLERKPESGRLSTGIADMDLVLGGGLVPGLLALLAGEPGVGKSTLVLEIARAFQGKFYYFSGEESVEQIALRADRLELPGERLFISRETDPELICERIRRERPDLAVIDSIQTVYRPGGQQIPGMIGPLKEAAMLFLETARATETPILLTGHITKEGNVAGPRLLEHMVDAVLYFESDRLNHMRVLRAIKNRFGAVGEVALFEMHSRGLRTVEPAHPFRDESHSAPGRVCSVLLEGSRAIPVEVQALVSRAAYGPARRTAEGLDQRRLLLLGAVLEKYGKVRLAECDIFANLAGGLSSDEPALDLALAAAILSSYQEMAVPPTLGCLGEVGLSGEIRPVSRLPERILELSRLAIQQVLVPKAALKNMEQDERLSAAGVPELIGVADIGDLIAILNRSVPR
ncbi:MAG: DNA repair protein RadA [Leptospiraceae bacterium]|nr:DNA repair protein RadA [Leptospiraceae bacterium]